MSNELEKEIPSPLAMRDLIEEMAIKEMLGPVGGEEEEVDERIRDRYEPYSSTCHCMKAIRL
jgi:hypothetical protein